MMRRVPFALATRGAMLVALCHAPLAQAAAPPPISLPASCLDSPTFEAARFHQFQTMMMTVSLRCKSHGMDVETSFSRMMIVHQGVFAAARADDKYVHHEIPDCVGREDRYPRRRAWLTRCLRVAATRGRNRSRSLCPG